MENEFREYIRSHKFQHKQKLFKQSYCKKNKWLCYICGTNHESIFITHKNYDNLYNETVDDFIPICYLCNSTLKEYKKENKFKKRDICIEELKELYQ